MEFAKLFLRNLLVELEKRNPEGDEEYEHGDMGGMGGMGGRESITAEEGQSLTINIYRVNCIPSATMEKGGTITMNIHDDTDITLCNFSGVNSTYITIEPGGELIINTVGSTLPIINKNSLLKYIDKENMRSKLTINYNAKL